MANAPQSIKDAEEAARIRAEAARIEESTRAQELENARLDGELKGRMARRAA